MTIEAYSRASRRLGEHFHHRIDDFSEAQLTDYFSDLIESYSWSAVKLDLDRLKFNTTHVPRKPRAMHLLTQAKNNISALELKRHLGMRYKTAWPMKHKLMQVMCLREDSRRLDGRVEIDDAYLGRELPGGKSGRGSENKVPFVAAIQTTDAGHPLFVCLTKLEFTKETIAQWANKSRCASARVVSDGLWCFRAVSAAGQSEDRLLRYLPFVRLCQVCRSLSRRVPVPIQSSFRSLCHSRQATPCIVCHLPPFRTRHPGG